MKLFRVPNVLMHAVPNSSLVAPDGSLIYISYAQISLIRPNNNAEVVLLDAKQKLLSIDCDPEWSETEYLACATEDRHVWLWNVKLRAVVTGHTAHCDTKEKDSPLPLCFTEDKKVVSADKKLLVVWDVLQNTYKTNAEIVRKHCITVLKVSPYNLDLIAAGTQAGLVILISLRKMESFFTLRGHDQAIWSLDWIKVPAVDLPDDDDPFDIYTYEDVENEFGVSRDKPAPDSEEEEGEITQASRSFQDPGHDNGFDFVEACETLKKDIKGESKNCDAVDDIDTNPNREECQSTNIHDDTDSMSDSNESVISQNSVRSGRSIGSKSQSSRKSGSNGRKQSPVDPQDRFLLVTGSSESHITVWDAKSGKSIEKINLPGSRSHGNQRQQFQSKNIVVRWLDHKKLLSNDSNGFLILWDVEQKNDRFIFHKSSLQFQQKAVADIVVERNTQDFWVLSAHQQITCLNLDLKSPRYDYSTLQPRNQAIAVNQLDPNVIAVGSVRRVSLMNLSKVSSTHAVFGSMTQKVQSQVLSLAFHPSRENLLAFSTREGRVGTFDTNRCANAPILMKPYFGKDVYAVTWIQQKNGNDYDLYCCGQGKLVYFPQSGSKKYEAVEIPEFKSVTNVGASDEYISIGTHDGNVTICDYLSNLKKVFSEKVSNKFISSFSWKKKLLGVASFENSFLVFDFSNLGNISKLVFSGHEGPVTFLNWHPFKESILVSSSYDSTVKVWDTKTNSCISSTTFEREMFISVFHPNMEHTVIAGGIESMLTIFNYKTSEEISFKPKIASKQNKPPTFDLKMAKPNDGNLQKKARRERRRNQRADNSAPVEGNGENSSQVDEIENKLLSVKIKTESQELEPSQQAKLKKEILNKEKLEYNYTTIFCLSMRDLNRDPMSVLNKLISEREEGKQDSRYARLFSKDDKLVKSVLDEELLNHKTSNSKSVGRMIFPMVTADLKKMIFEKAETKSLTEEYVALAPMVHYEFWRDMCYLFALQCVDKGEIFRAVPYFICDDKNLEAVEALYKNHYYLEAVGVAKMLIYEKHEIHEKLIEEWTKYLINCGNFEAAAIVFTASEHYEDAINVLNRRQNPKPELVEIIEKLKETRKSYEQKKKTESKSKTKEEIELPFKKLQLPKGSEFFPKMDFVEFVQNESEWSDSDCEIAEEYQDIKY